MAVASWMEVVAESASYPSAAADHLESVLLGNL